MSVTRIRDEGQTLHYPTGKLLGIVDTRAQLDQLVPALRAAGLNKIEALVGEEGVALLERMGRSSSATWKSASSTGTSKN